MKRKKNNAIIGNNQMTYSKILNEKKKKCYNIGNNQMTYSKILNEISQVKRWTQKGCSYTCSYIDVI